MKFALWKTTKKPNQISLYPDGDSKPRLPECKAKLWPRPACHCHLTFSSALVNIYMYNVIVSAFCLHTVFASFLWFQEQTVVIYLSE
jgi:hypothetical protein